jgi:hypothetical protein
MADDVKALPKTIQVSELKNNVTVLNSNSHQLKIGHTGVTNDYSTANK